MCLIIHRPVSEKGRGSNVPNEILEYNRRKNPDGFGLAWRKKGVLNYEKFGPRDYDTFYELLKKIDKQTDIEYTAHYRLATHGPINEAMAHPFVYDDKKAGEVAIFHNGVIPITAPNTESDTSQFVKTVLSRLASQWWKKGAYKFLVEQSMGWSRLLVMTDTDTVMLSDDWKLLGGIWYSTEPGPWRPVGKPTTADKAGEDFTYGRSAYSGKGYTPPAEWLSEDGEDNEDDLLYQKYTDAVSQSGWKDHGHWVEPITENYDNAGDVSGEVVCTTCNGYGDYYRIDGQFFFDVSHVETEDDVPELSKAQQQLLLPAPMPVVAAGENL